MAKIQTHYLVTADGVVKYTSTAALANLFRGTEPGCENEYEFYTDKDEAERRHQRLESERLVTAQLKAMSDEEFAKACDMLAKK